ncbi:oligopeptide/dipeptide ABC transporter ATP-binding protein [Bradyrhizobium sp. LHD-71]|uniref:ABC transporter ATP-binding protein n=1 Tax=Bradyrhizobium sp. LHD-71 TaxID=3072141 RepID=UPI00280D1FCB|nr:oligopeptide/dipeptide ABC transporter ATP-binding protein [Bradyrhizobium sp. LHD-71]MDQ8727446.1 ATP-binding cassette domain-containing protein [Bradyrhizobium sp. LHD-71]
MGLELRNLSKHFSVRTDQGKATVRAVEGVNLEIPAGQTVALVGESGCGKTTIAKLALMLEQPSSGAVNFDGKSLGEMSRSEIKDYRRQVQAVFQDPYASLNPRLTVRRIITEPILAHYSPDRVTLNARVAELLEIVGLPAAAADLYPHEFSGGQRQRIAIARALALNPKIIILDEPISALDVSIRAQVLNLLMDIQEKFGLTYLLIAHDLALVEHLSTRVAVIYLGSVVECGPSEQIFSAPQHPYTQALLNAVPRPDPDYVPKAADGFDDTGSALEPPSGCKFHPRCPYAMAVCKIDNPPLLKLPDGREAACHLLTGPHAAQM